MQKTITFAIPCYNSAAYMDHCIESILEGSDYAKDVQIVIVDDGSTKDDTAMRADLWQARHPDIIKAVHQENGGHGIAVMAGVKAADGVYYKVVDSDDWLDIFALQKLLETLRHFIEFDTRVDLVITNYVYEHVEDGKQNIVDYRYALPRGKIITWDKIGHFNMAQNLLMHSLCYRVDILRAGGVPMPSHTFYVDNIYAYVPLPRCKTLYYLDVDLYRYFIGRGDQSVNESVMISRIDQQLRITRVMMHAYHLYDEVESVKLRSYMVSYFTLMMAVCSVFSRLSDKPDAMDNCEELWDELKAYDIRMYRRARMGAVGTATNLPTKAGEKATIGIYRVAQKLVKFN
ncbi:MAG: glycosyltransferase family 2 protein [Atopobiaceae bacterium]|jgi:glycosyltransferase involved in cell wall biosynthesis|nr:glycosyltransferase family 2 protein [Atopobiaceae bacterium]